MATPVRKITEDTEAGGRDLLVQNGALSTDYLNRYNEALMLIEMAAMDASVVEDLRAWQPLGYVRHFETSNLRCGPGAIAAYQALPPISRGAFESLCSAMDRLVRTVVHALGELRDPADSVYVVEIGVGSFRSLLARATGFINTGGDIAAAAYDEDGVQDTVDRLMASPS